jgi:hypothetical protein
MYRRNESVNYFFLQGSQAASSGFPHLCCARIHFMVSYASINAGPSGRAV